MHHGNRPWRWTGKRGARPASPEQYRPARKRQRRQDPMHQNRRQAQPPPPRQRRPPPLRQRCQKPMHQFLRPQRSPSPNQRAPQDPMHQNTRPACAAPRSRPARRQRQKPMHQFLQPRRSLRWRAPERNRRQNPMHQYVPPKRTVSAGRYRSAARRAAGCAGRSTCIKTSPELPGDTTTPRNLLPPPPGPLVRGGRPGRTPPSRLAIIPPHAT